MIFKNCVIASTFSYNTDFNIQRTPYIYSNDAVIEINKQIHQLGNDGIKLDVLLQTPIVDYLKISIPDIDKKALKENGVIGKLLFSEIETNSELDVLQIKGTVEIINDIIADVICKDKDDLCFFTLIAYNPNASLRTVAITEKNTNNVAILTPPLKIVGLSLGTKRQSSNPYLCIG